MKHKDLFSIAFGSLLVGAWWLIMGFCLPAVAADGFANAVLSYTEQADIDPGQAVTFTFSEFDPALGVLSKVEIECETEMQNPAWYGPPSGDGLAFRVRNTMPGAMPWVAWAEVQGPWSKTRLSLGGVALLAPRVEAPFIRIEVPNVSAYSFEEKLVLSNPGSDTGSVAWTDQETLSRFTGTGDFDVLLETTYGGNTITSGNLTSSIIGWLNRSRVTVFYTYTERRGAGR